MRLIILLTAALRQTGHVSVWGNSPHFVLHVAPVVRAASAALLLALRSAAAKTEREDGQRCMSSLKFSRTTVRGSSH